MLEFRKATVDDIELLVEYRIIFLSEALKYPLNTPTENLSNELKKYFKSTIPTEEFIAWLAFNGTECVATSGISFYTIPPRLSNPTGREAYIMNMYTKPEWRRKGIGTQLFEKLLVEAKNKNIKKITLHATEDGRPLYEKYGFEFDKEAMMLKIRE